MFTPHKAALDVEDSTYAVSFFLKPDSNILYLSGTFSFYTAFNPSKGDLHTIYCSDGLKTTFYDLKFIEFSIISTSNFYFFEIVNKRIEFFNELVRCLAFTPSKKRLPGILSYNEEYNCFTFSSEEFLDEPSLLIAYEHGLSKHRKDFDVLFFEDSIFSRNRIFYLGIN